MNEKTVTPIKATKINKATWVIKKGTKKHTAPSIDKRRPTPTAALSIDTANNNAAKGNLKRHMTWIGIKSRYIKCSKWELSIQFSNQQCKK